jgi:RNase P subunit RPR2
MADLGVVGVSMFKAWFCKHDYVVLINSCMIEKCRFSDSFLGTYVDVMCMKCHKVKRIKAASSAELHIRIKDYEQLRIKDYEQHR